MPATTRNRDNAVERYAHLNRIVERGDATGATRKQLMRVCVQLDKRDEAIAAFNSIEDPDLRRALRPELARLGWVSAQNDPEELRALMVTDATLNPTLGEKLADAVQLLGDGRMRTNVLVCTAAFPVVLGVGGMLASGTDFFLLRLIAALPALLIVGTVGELGRHVLTLTIEGHDDSTDLPELPQLIRGSWRSLIDFAALSAVFLGPSAILLWQGAPVPSLALLLLAGLFMPLTTALRLAGTRWRCLTPRRIVTAVGRLTPSYLRVAGAIALLLGPAVLVLFLTAGLHFLVTLSVTGPLAVAPALMSARILGLTLHYERNRLGELFTLPGDADRPPLGSRNTGPSPV